MKVRRPQKVFVTEKTHSKTKNLRLVIELAIVVLVIVGTGFTVFGLNDFSYDKFFDRTKELFRLKKEEITKPTEITFEEKIKREIDKKILNFSTIQETSGGNYKIKTRERVLVYISASKDLEFQSGTLQRLLSKAKIEKKTLILVDFRFDKLVVRYKQSP